MEFVAQELAEETVTVIALPAKEIIQAYQIIVPADQAVIALAQPATMEFAELSANQTVIAQLENKPV